MEAKSRTRRCSPDLTQLGGDVSILGEAARGRSSGHANRGPMSAGASSGELAEGFTGRRAGLAPLHATPVTKKRSFVKDGLTRNGPWSHFVRALVASSGASSPRRGHDPRYAQR